MGQGPPAQRRCRLISLRPTEPGDLPGLSALFESRFGHPLAPEEWTWKYRQLPGESRSLVAVEAVEAVEGGEAGKAVEAGEADAAGEAVYPAGPGGGGGEVVAHAGALRLPARWRGGQGGIWQLVDFAGRSAGRGLRPALVRLGERLLADLPGDGDAPWVFGFPSDRHFRLGERVFGYRPLLTVAQLAGPLPEPAPSSLLAAPIAGGCDPGNDTGLWSGDSCGDWAEAVWESCAVAGVRRSAAFLNWRYWARPHRYYRFYRLRQRGVEGLAVFAFVGEEAWATELWLPPAGEWYSPMLAIAADLRTAGLRSWRFWPPPGNLDADGLLARLGIHPEGEPRFVGCRGAAPCRVDPVAAAGGFYYAMGDHDLA
jgi:hypothetical protein